MVGYFLGGQIDDLHMEMKDVGLHIKNLYSSNREMAREAEGDSDRLRGGFMARRHGFMNVKISDHESEIMRYRIPLLIANRRRMRRGMQWTTMRTATAQAERLTQQLDHQQPTTPYLEV